MKILINRTFPKFRQIFPIIFLLMVIKPAFTGDINREIKNQFVGGLLGSAVGSILGVGIASLDQNELSDLRKYFTYALYGQTVGNSLGHFVVSEKSSPYPLILSLTAGLFVTTYLAKDEGKFLVGDYYRSFQSYGGNFTYFSSLTLYQPIITTITHILWPKSKATISLKIHENEFQGISVSYPFKI